MKNFTVLRNIQSFIGHFRYNYSMQRSRVSTIKNLDTGSVPGNVILIGMMGAGKTTIGKLLAGQIGKTFIDADHEIQERTGVRIPVIFEIEGEAGFRKRETEVLREIVQLQNIVLATGGGAILRPENRALLRRHGTVVYLCAPVSELQRRTRLDKNRPLLQTGNLHARLQELYTQRDPIYRQTAHIIVDSGRQGVRVLVQKLIQKLLQFKPERAEHPPRHPSPNKESE
ncbi:shikimate kinase [Nitrosomonas sp. ANs5]|uniref:shikimate kinase n=1 Tax=Nitrosomonas sp. ANs5 TaxID=3423941 RepID=UPI003D32E0A1